MPAGRPPVGWVAAEVSSLVDSAWQPDETLEAARRVLGGRALPPNTAVLAVGFGGGRTRLGGLFSPLERELLGVLDARHFGGAPDDHPDSGPLPALLLPDVAAEARAAARAVLGLGRAPGKRRSRCLG